MAGLMAVGLGASAQSLLVAAPSASNRFAKLADTGESGVVLVRGALRSPARWRVLMVPGSGCTSLAPSADRLARGLGHAQVVLLQKPHLSDGAADTDNPCTSAFLHNDNLIDWQRRAMRLAAAGLAATDSELPLVLMGLSEGAELLPGLASAWPDAAALVMVGHAGLDPWQAGHLQAERLGLGAEWRALTSATAQARSDDAILEGRHWRYWLALQRWPLMAPLLSDPRPLLHAWGELDGLMPPAAYQLFSQQARLRAGGYCPLIFSQADHELRTPGSDRLQPVWRWLDRAAPSLLKANAVDRANQAAAWLAGCAAWQTAAAIP
jgi:hypothetical protein